MYQLILPLIDLPSETKIALVGYKYDRALQEITPNTKKLNVELLGKPQSIDAPLNICPAKDDVQDAQIDPCYCYFICC